MKNDSFLLLFRESCCCCCLWGNFAIDFNNKEVLGNNYTRTKRRFLRRKVIQNKFLKNSGPHGSDRSPFYAVSQKHAEKNKGQGWARFPEILQNFSERQIFWSLCSVIFLALTFEISVAPELQVCLRSGENLRKTSTSLGQSPIVPMGILDPLLEKL